MKRVALGLSAVLLAAMPGHGRDLASGDPRLAYACGWYAISVCATEIAPARDARETWGSGEVIDTSALDFPNFADGHFCHVIGPRDKGGAEIAAMRLRQNGFGSAYAKYAC
ncbi:hypothetical protein [Xanthobacter sp. KR7-225]|uniref:hypothetical protein n=1 Tax=Xanthobacter sp. KR7-225 TaxID=3156613 RepID=UPI0032B346E9